MIGKFKRKPIDVRAIQLKESNFNEVHEFLCHVDHMRKIKSYFSSEVDMRNNLPSGIFIKTDEGNLLLKVGSWVVKTKEGDYFVHSDKIFRSEYERID